MAVVGCSVVGVKSFDVVMNVVILVVPFVLCVNV
jgi:hypothetical protein